LWKQADDKVVFGADLKRRYVGTLQMMPII
jgi:hypothetical protein